jgi:hypothetical protein
LVADEKYCPYIDDSSRPGGAVNATGDISLLRLMVLAPEIVEAILDWRQPKGMALPRLIRGWRWSGSVGDPPSPRP